MSDDLAAKLRSIAQDWDSDGELHQAMAGAAAELDEQSAELERLKTACDNRLCSACLEVHPLGATCPPHEMRTTGSAWFRGRMSELQQAVSEAESRANERGRKMIQCCFCNEQCESLEALKTHSVTCADHPAVKAGQIYRELVQHRNKCVRRQRDMIVALEQQVAALTQQVRRHAEYWAETDTHIRAVAKRFLPDAMVDGDSQGVPPIEDVVDGLELVIDALSDHIDKVEQQVSALRAENARLNELVDGTEAACSDEEAGHRDTLRLLELREVRIAELEGHVAALREDAERYRFIRSRIFERYGNGQEHVLYFPPGHLIGPFDEVIDAEMAKSRE